MYHGMKYHLHGQENTQSKLKGVETMETNTLYLMEMGMHDDNISTDVKNHRVRVIENIDIVYKGKKYNMFFEFTQGEHCNYRTTNKRTGAQLKKAVKETILKDGIYIDTQFEKLETDSTGRTWFSSWRKSDLEEEFYKEHLAYTKESILKIVNRYKIGAPFTDVCLIETTAADIIRKKGGYREKEILGENKNFQTEGGHYFTIGKTWTEEHKTVRCNKQEWKPCENGRRLETTDFCEVDLITGKITL